MKAKKPSLQRMSNVPAKLDTAGPEREWCKQCALYKHCDRPFATPLIPSDWTRKLLVVLGGPEKNEDKGLVKFFGGRSSKLLKKLYKRAGYSHQDVAIVYSIRCHVPGNSSPSMRQIRACRPFLLNVINGLQPDNVIGLGSTALRALTNSGAENITASRGVSLSIPWEMVGPQESNR